MSRFRDLSIQRKLLVLMMGTTVMALLLAALAFLAYDYITVKANLATNVETLASTLGTSTVTGLVFNDDDQVRQILAGLEMHPHVQTAAVYDKDGQVFASFERASRDAGRFAEAAAAALGGKAWHEFVNGALFVHQPMAFGNSVAGTIHIESDLAEIDARLRNYLLVLVLVIASVSVLSFIFSSGLQRLVSKPVLQLVDTVHTVTDRRDYGIRAKSHGRDEVGRLIDGFNDMLAQIQARDQELIIARDKAEQANRSKSVFLANMSHELRTPLTAIIGYSEILEDDAGDMGLEDFLPDLQKIKAAGKHLLGLINSILDLSKVEAGKMELYVEPFEIQVLVSEVASTVMPLVEKNRNHLEVRVPEDLRGARGDLTKTRQILFNLLSNASKFTEGGTVTLDVSEQAEGGVDGFLFKIADTGIGMTREQMSRLFKPFSQADATTARKYGGTGLGLVLCKRFCQVMGGRIDVDSTPGGGTTFTVWLPAEVDEEKPVSLKTLVESGEWRISETSGRATPDGDAPLVLVIDDDLAVHDLLRDLLVKEGFRVATAASGEEGLDLARRLLPAIIILDVYLPGMDGWSVLSTLKAQTDLGGIPVIMISVSDQQKKGYALGAEYLTKPIDRRRMAALLEKYRNGAGGQPLGLVIDDDPEIRELTCRVLEEQGWRVAEADNGIAGLRRVADQPPDLILLDLIMPQLDGFGFLAQLRKNAEWKRIPVVVLTAMDLGAQERERLNGGVEQVLQKGAYTLEELKAEIRALARGSVSA